jgi:hypothetical protein
MRAEIWSQADMDSSAENPDLHTGEMEATTHWIGEYSHPRLRLLMPV